MDYTKLTDHESMLLYPFTGERPVHLTDDKIQDYAEDNIEHFTTMLEMYDAGSTIIRDDECRLYLQLWKDISKTPSWDQLDSRQRGQLMDAYYDEFGGDDEPESYSY